MSTKAFGYIRVSGLGQVDGDGPLRQREAIEKYAAINDFEIVEWFSDDGVSGTKEIDDRPALAEMLVALEENGVKVAICERLDRLARSLMVQETIICDMQKHGYIMISTLEPDLCSEDPSRVLMRQIFGAVAQYDRAMLTAKLRAARERIRREGRRPGSKNYSLDPVKNSKPCGRTAFGDREEEKDAFNSILDLHKNGYTATRIAAYLNLTGLKSRSTKPWRSSVVSKILRRIK